MKGFQQLFVMLKLLVVLVACLPAYFTNWPVAGC